MLDSKHGKENLYGNCHISILVHILSFAGKKVRILMGTCSQEPWKPKFCSLYLRGVRI